MRVGLCDHRLKKSGTWRACGNEPLTSILSPCSRGEAKRLPIVLRRRNFTSGITGADLSFVN
jgi:hypothetical protein